MQPPPPRVRPLRSALAAAIVVLPLGAVMLAPTWAGAVVAAPTTSKPVIAGTPQVGATLTATATWTGDPAPTVQWEWLRCPDSKGGCVPITGATSARYVVIGADVGLLLRVRITVTNSEGSDSARSEPTTVVTAAPPAPAPTPAPTPAPAPSPSPSPQPSPSATATPAPGPVDDAAAGQPGPTSVADQPTSTGSAGPDAPPTRLLRPFPLVRIAGLLTPAGARVTLLAVRAPRGVRIAVRCRGRLCPYRRLARIATVLRLRDLERDLLAGTRIDIMITKSGYIGKWTTIKIRRGAPPARLDRCVYPSGRRPFSCPE